MANGKSGAETRRIPSEFKRNLASGCVLWPAVWIAGAGAYLLYLSIAGPAYEWKSTFREEVYQGARGYFAVYGYWPGSQEELLSRMDGWASASCRADARTHGMTMRVESSPNALTFRAHVSVRTPRLEFDVEASPPEPEKAARAAGLYFYEAWMQRHPDEDFVSPPTKKDGPTK